MKSIDFEYSIKFEKFECNGNETKKCITNCYKYT
jgi:hypothetical protein